MTGAVVWAVALTALLRQAAGLLLLLRYLRRARVASIPKGETPGISILKPLYGDDPGLLENLEATLRQNYPDFEVLFLHERPDDPAIAAADEAMRRVPDVHARRIQGRDAEAANPKVAVVLRGEAVARHGIVAVADSDVRPDPLYLRDIANGLLDAEAVSFVPVVYGMRGFWSRLGGLLFDTEAVLAVLLGRGRVMTGATVGIRREALAKVGGYRAVADRIAEDYGMGVLLRRAGCRLALARRAARLHAPGGGFRETGRHALRWARTVRSAAPLLYALALPLSTAPLLLLLQGGPLALTALGLHTAVRAAVALLVDFRFCWDRSLVRALPLLPLLWVLEPLNLLLGLFGSTVDWRGRRYRVRGGRATLLPR
ncbi:MAG TPA: glycosyltransferase [Planctomycetota bacterium]|nr:glycosyltransferase [Planctomycetota bacterium]